MFTCEHLSKWPFDWISSFSESEPTIFGRVVRYQMDYKVLEMVTIGNTYMSDDGINVGALKMFGWRWLTEQTISN